MAAIGELAQVAREEMKYCVDDLCPIIMDMLQDSSSLAKREVALWTFGQLVENTGYVNVMSGYLHAVGRIHVCVGLVVIKGLIMG